MAIWPNSKMTTLYYSAHDASIDYPCIVKIDDETVRVEYEDSGRSGCYEGKNHGDGHFELTSSNTDGRATLHRYPDRSGVTTGSSVLEGCWEERGYRGMWRIKLALGDDE